MDESIVLRVFGEYLDVAALAGSKSLKSFRVDDRRTTSAAFSCIYDEVPTGTMPTEAGHSDVMTRFLQEHATEIDKISEREDVQGMEIDLGVMLQKDDVMTSCRFDPILLSHLARLKCDLLISVYKTEG